MKEYRNTFYNMKITDAQTEEDHENRLHCTQHEVRRDNYLICSYWNNKPPSVKKLSRTE
jgi:hypothetical protein